MVLLRSLVLAVLLPSVANDGRDRVAPEAPLARDEGVAVVAFEIPDRPGARREHFELLRGGERIGLARATVGARPSALRAELSFDLWPIRTRVHHVERLGPRGPRLVWREVRERSGRTVLVEWSEDGERLVHVDWSGGDALRRESVPASGAVLPLFLVASVRSGDFPSGRFDVYDAPSGAVEELVVHTRRFALLPGGPPTARRLVLSHVDGTLAGEYLFLGPELIAFRMQEDGPVAVCIRAATHHLYEREEEERREEDTRAPQAAQRTTGVPAQRSSG